jgi:hypothetical protein
VVRTLSLILLPRQFRPPTDVSKQAVLMRVLVYRTCAYDKQFRPSYERDPQPSQPAPNHLGTTLRVLRSPSKPAVMDTSLSIVNRKNNKNAIECPAKATGVRRCTRCPLLRHRLTHTNSAPHTLLTARGAMTGNFCHSFVVALGCQSQRDRGPGGQTGSSEQARHQRHRPLNPPYVRPRSSVDAGP